MKNTKKHIALVIALSSITTTSLPAMANIVDLRVIGAITPGSCTATLGGGGTFDYGTISPSSLSATDFTLLPVISLPISITCTAATKAALRPVNGRPNTLAGASEGTSGYGTTPIPLFGMNSAAGGLGLDGTDKIGGYSVQLVNGLADGTSVDILNRNGPTGAWGKSTIGVLFNSISVRDTSWGATGTIVPIEFTDFSGTLQVQAYLNKSTDLDLSKPINLDGFSTLELVYL